MNFEVLFKLEKFCAVFCILVFEEMIDCSMRLSWGSLTFLFDGTQLGGLAFLFDDSAGGVSHVFVR